MSWDSNVVAAYRFENNGNDDTGNGYSLATIGTGPLFKTDIVKYGTYSYSVAENGNRYDFSSTLATALAALDEWTIETWFWKPADGGYVHEPILSSAWESGLNTLVINPRDGNYFEVRALTTTGGTYSYDWGDRPGWKHVSFQWSADTDQLLVYVNGSLAITINSVTSNVFAVSADGFHIGNDPAFGGIKNSEVRIDRIVISDVLRNGVETLKISDPTISNIDPAIGSGFGGTDVEIDGTEFQTGATVDFDGTPATDVVVVSAIKITCKTPAHAAGLVDVVITNPDTGTVTEVNGFEYTFPTITSVYPARGSTVGGRSVTIIGTGFLAGAVFDFDGAFATNVVIVSPTEATCTTPAHSAGLSDITITNADTSTGTLTDGFEYYILTTQTSLKRNSLFLNGKDITKYQAERFFLNEELNIIDSWDFNFSGLESYLPIKLYNYLFEHAENIIEAKNEKDVSIYQGKIWKKSIDCQAGLFNLQSIPFIDTLSTSFNAYAQTIAKNGVDILKALLEDFLPSQYSIINAVGVKAFFKDINIYLDTDSKDENIMALALSICELLKIGIYFDGLNIKFFPVVSFPLTAKDMEPYIIEGGKPFIDELPDLYFDQLNFKYKNDKAADEEIITVGDGNIIQEFSVGNSIYMTDAVAALIAAKHLEIGMKKYNSFVCSVKRNAPFVLADYFTYTTISGTFLGVIRKKEYEGNQIQITGIGEWL
jgi:hypothetical protein